ncbi:FAD-binding oxidoreductase [Rhodovulum sp. 12E13]|uniref:NAD(P)/FAD-dependent oxidoreductase n=1 Tax=Rhodovulum sp. 12E13 TaxID=2203891 RepID=UPI000E1323E4|nr:FAD-binding oxidoreductase [Rhodovulum sp. 12E13]RDC73969.1 FAD-binding oxidoreductase [Rhodovulum sp. 12E13]
MGGGVWGLACAWEMARRGARVRLIERDRIGAGASGGVVGALAPHAPERWGPLKAFQLDSLLAAEGFWAGVADASGLSPGYARTGRLQPIADAAALARAEERVAAARTLWRGAADWRVIDAAEAGDWAPASPTGKLVHETLAARLHPRQAGAALAAAIRARGGEVVEGHGAAAPEPETEPVIWATGAAGLADLSAAFGREVGRPVKGQAAVLGLDRPGTPQIGGEGLFVVSHEDGTVAVGSTAERDFGDPHATDAQLDDVIARARATVPALREAPVLHRWAGLRPRARSRRPMLGGWPGRPGHHVANGGFKIGFGLAPGVARVMADLVLDGRDTIPQGCRVEDSL